jgi:hypothetical protein
MMRPRGAAASGEVPRRPGAEAAEGQRLEAVVEAGDHCQVEAEVGEVLLQTEVVEEAVVGVHPFQEEEEEEVVGEEVPLRLEAAEAEVAEEPNPLAAEEAAAEVAEELNPSAVAEAAAERAPETILLPQTEPEFPSSPS